MDTILSFLFPVPFLKPPIEPAQRTYKSQFKITISVTPGMPKKPEAPRLKGLTGRNTPVYDDVKSIAAKAANPSIAENKKLFILLKPSFPVRLYK